MLSSSGADTDLLESSEPVANGLGRHRSHTSSLPSSYVTARRSNGRAATSDAAAASGAAASEDKHSTDTSSSSSSSSKSSHSKHKRGTRASTTNSSKEVSNSSSSKQVSSSSSKEVSSTRREEITSSSSSKQLRPEDLTKLLLGSQSLYQLQQLLEEHMPDTNAIHVSAALRHVSTLLERRGKQPYKQQQQREGQVEGKGEEQTLTLPRRQQQQQREEGEGQERRERQQEQEQAPQGLGLQMQEPSLQPQQQQQQQVAFKLARDLVDRLLQLPLDAVDDRALVSCCYCLGRLRLADERLLLSLLQLLRPRLLDLEPMHICNIAWALATLGCNPPGDFGPALLTASQQILGSCSSQGLANLVWSFAKLGLSPSEVWWEGFWSASQPQLQHAKPQELALMMYGCGRLGPKPGVPLWWGDAWLGASCDNLQQHSIGELTMSLWGLDGAGVNPHKAWLMLWFMVSQELMGKAAPQVSVGLWGWG